MKLILDRMNPPNLDNKLFKVLLACYATLFAAFLMYFVMPQVDFYLDIILRNFLDNIFPVIAVLLLLTSIILLFFTFRSSKRKLFIVLSTVTLFLVPLGWAFLSFINTQETLLSGPELISISPNGQNRIDSYHFYDGEGWSFVNFEYEIFVLRRDWHLPKTLLVVDQYNQDQCAVALERARQKTINAVFEPNKYEFDKLRRLLEYSGGASENQGSGKLKDASLEATEYAFILNILRNEKLSKELSLHKKSEALQKDLREYQELKSYFFEKPFIQELDRTAALTQFNNNEWNDRKLVGDTVSLNKPWQGESSLFKQRFEKLLKLDDLYDKAKLESKSAGTRWIDDENIEIVGKRLSIKGQQVFCRN